MYGSSSPHGPADVVGHRVVHGGNEFMGPVVVDQTAEGASRRSSRSHRSIRSGGWTGSGPPGAAPGGDPGRVLRHRVPCGDAARGCDYPLPAEWRERWPIRRYGFHGLSHAYAVRRAGACSVRGRICASSAATSGAARRCVPHATGARSTRPWGSRPSTASSWQALGAIDPGLVLWLIRNIDGGLDEVDRGLEERSGLVGLAGGTGDMRDIVDRRHGEARGARLRRLPAPSRRPDRGDDCGDRGPRRACLHPRGGGTLAEVPRNSSAGSPSSASASTRALNAAAGADDRDISRPDQQSARSSSDPAKTSDRTSDPLSRART